MVATRLKKQINTVQAINNKSGYYAQVSQEQANIAVSAIETVAAKEANTIAHAELAGDYKNYARDWAVKTGSVVSDGYNDEDYSAKYYAEEAETSATNASASESNALDYKDSACSSASLAEDWASKMSDTVDGESYSAKYYALQATNGIISVEALETSGEISLEDNKVYTITPTDDIEFVLPLITDTSYFHQILIQLDLATVVDIDLGTDDNYLNGEEPNLTETGKYNIIYEYDVIDGAWYVGAIKKASAS